MESFEDYLERSLVGIDSTPALFNPWMWNLHENVFACLPRSSYLAEGWHNRFRCLTGCTNPTIWCFIDVLKKEQDNNNNNNNNNNNIRDLYLTDWKINQKMMRQLPPPQHKKWKDYVRKLNPIILSYDDFQINGC